MHSIPTRAALMPRLRQRKFEDDLEKVIFGRLLTEAHSDTARAELIERTGIHDETLLDELATLGLTVHTLMAIRLIPLVVVAWADQHVDPRERQVILKEAEKLGVRTGTDAYVMLDHWLREHPPAESVDAWQRYIRRVTRKLGNKTRQRFAGMIETQMLAVAKASGGLLGVGKVSAKERRTIARLTETLRAG